MSATDAATLIVVPLFLVVIAFLGAFIPARRAAPVDPVTALLAE